MLLSVRGQELFVDRAGAGRPLVLLHGLGTPSVWQRVREPLASSFDLASIHLPGFGSSLPSTTPLSVSGHADLVEGVLESLGLRDVVLCGLSYGGEVAATIAARRNVRVSKLVLIAAAGLQRGYAFLRSDLLFALARRVADATVLRDAGTIRRWNGRLYADPANQPEEIVSEFMAMVADPRRRECWFGCLRNGAVPEPGFRNGLANIAVPTTIVWGKQDRVIPVRYASELQKLVPRSELLVLDHCGHASPLEQPERLVAILRRAATPSA